MRLVTWNINSVRLRIEQLVRLIERYEPDVICLQEIKCSNDQFPAAAIRALGFDYIEVHGQKGYHGVATIARLPVRRVATHDFNGTDEARHLAVALLDLPSAAGPVVVHNFYIPAGGDVPDPACNPKFAQKLTYLQRLADEWQGGAAGLNDGAHHILTGDFNVAPLETDVWSHKQMLKVVSHTPIEVEHLQKVQQASGFVDVMRKFIPPDQKLFTWWSYRARDWRRSNRGRRLDHVWVTPGLADHAAHVEVLDEVRGWERPSDHAPVLTSFEF